MKKNLVEYCKYLINEYDKIKYGSGGGVMSDLEQFYETGTIKDLIAKNTSNKIKIDFLNIYCDKIVAFSKDHNLDIDLKNFYEFQNL